MAWMDNDHFRTHLLLRICAVEPAQGTICNMIRADGEKCSQHVQDNACHTQSRTEVVTMLPLMNLVMARPIVQAIW